VKAGQEYSRLQKLMRKRPHEKVQLVYGKDMSYERFEGQH